jgi:hypothetical protein
MPVFGVARLERFFRAAASLDVDRDDLKRLQDFIEHKLYDLLLMAQASAKANARDIVEPQDIPITKGLQECLHAFREVDEELDLEPILDRLTAYPPLDLALSEDTEAHLPAVVGALSVALARTFPLVAPDVKNPRTAEWERVFRLFDLLL